MLNEKQDMKKGHLASTNDDDTEICPDCKSNDSVIDHNRGERICQKCGMVLSSRLIDLGAEWRAFNSEERDKRSRVGSPSTYTVHDKGLSTIIGYENRDHFGNKLSASRRAQIYRLRKWQIRTRVHSSTDRNLAHAMSELDRLASQLGIPRNVKETSAIIYRKAIDNRLVRGRSIEAMIAATVYAAARVRRVPRTLDEIAAESRISKKELGRCYRLLIRKLQLNIPLASPVDYLVRFGTELGLSGLCCRSAANILQRAKEAGLTAGKDPTGLAAAAIYISGILKMERRTQRAIAEVAHVTEVTVRNRYKELVRQLNIEIQV
ncbi:MAG: transcription initiation factor IIB [Candidatus Hodarchaeales archaeon]|jgi:transcription initiation factor TFIIB